MSANVRAHVQVHVSICPLISKHLEICITPVCRLRLLRFSIPIRIVTICLYDYLHCGGILINNKNDMLMRNSNSKPFRVNRIHPAEIAIREDYSNHWIRSFATNKERENEEVLF